MTGDQVTVESLTLPVAISSLTSTSMHELYFDNDDEEVLPDLNPRP